MMTEEQYEQFDRTIFRYACAIIDRGARGELSEEQTRKHKDKLIEWLRYAEAQIEEVVVNE